MTLRLSALSIATCSNKRVFSPLRLQRRPRKT
jgi:hypothetical protein